MIWNHRVIIIVPAASKATAEAAARAIDPYGQNYDGDAFTMPLSADGNTPVTHWGMYTSATDEMVQSMADSAPAIEGVLFWRHDTDGVLRASNATEASGQAWGWDDSLAAAGLMPVVATAPMP